MDETTLLSDSGTPGILAALAVIGALRLVAYFFDFVWKLRERKDAAVQRGLHSLSVAVQQNTAATVALDTRLKTLEVTLATAARTKIDVRRLFAIVKILAGDDWDAIRRQVAEGENDEEDAA